MSGLGSLGWNHLACLLNVSFSALSFKQARHSRDRYVRPHAITIDHKDNVWLVDDMANTITKCDTSGKRLMLLGPNGYISTDRDEMEELAGRPMPSPGAPQSNKMFNRPTDIAIHPITGELFVTDG